MRKGFIRLGIFLTVIWVMCVLTIFIYEFLGQNIFCQLDTPVASGIACEHVLCTATRAFACSAWPRASPSATAWPSAPTAARCTGATPAHTASSTFTTDLASEAKQVFTPNVWQVVSLAFGVPAFGWILGCGIAWVMNGFKSNDSRTE